MDTFINACLDAAQKYNYTGYNIDFEPTDAATSRDAVRYAEFVNKFADALHKIGKTLSVCVASWNDFWNFTALAQTSVDKVMTMDTYAGSFDDFKASLSKAIREVGLNKLGVGLITTITSDAALKERFDLIHSNNVNEIDIWDTPIPEKFQMS